MIELDKEILIQMEKKARQIFVDQNPSLKNISFSKFSNFG